MFATLTLCLTFAAAPELPEGAIFRFGDARWRHPSGISHSVLSPDGKRLATAGSSSVMVFDMATGEPLFRFPCESGNTYSRPGLGFSGDGKRLAYVRNPTFARAWDLTTGETIGTFTDGPFSTYCRLDETGRTLLLSTSDDSQIRDLETGEVDRIPVKTIETLSADGKRFVRVNERRNIEIGDMPTGKVTHTWAVHAAANGAEESVAISPDGKSMAVVSFAGHLEIRDLPGGKVRQTFPLPEKMADALTAGKYYDHRVAFAGPDMVVMGTQHYNLHRYDLAAGKELDVLRREHGTLAAFHLMPDGKTLVITSSDRRVRKSDLRTGKDLSEFAPYGQSVRSALTPDGRFAVIGDDTGRLDVWDVRARTSRTLREPGPRRITEVAISPDGRTAAVGDHIGIVELWNLADGRRLRSFLPVEDGRQQRDVAGLAFSPDGSQLYISARMSRLDCYRVADGESLWARAGGGKVAASPDGRSVLCGDHGRLLRFDAESGEPINEAHSFGSSVTYELRPEALAYSPDGRTFAVGLTDGTVEIRDAASGRKLRGWAAADPRPVDPVAWRMGLEPRPVTALAYSADGCWLATGADDNSLRVWEARSGLQLWRRDGHDSPVNNISFDTRSRRLLSGGGDGFAYLWDLTPDVEMAAAEAWDDLLTSDGDKAFQAIAALRSHPSAVAALRDRLSPAKPLASPEELRRLIADLGSPRFATRESAGQKLLSHGRPIIPALRSALKGEISAETDRRLRDLIARLDGEWSPAELRVERAATAMRLAGTEESRALLAEWAGGADGAILTESARSSLRTLNLTGR